MANQTSPRGGVSVIGLLGVAFVVLKLCKVIDWSWLWVLAPFWMGLALALAILLAILAAATTAAVAAAIFSR